MRTSERTAPVRSSPRQSSTHPAGTPSKLRRHDSQAVTPKANPSRSVVVSITSRSSRTGREVVTAENEGDGEDAGDEDAESEADDAASRADLTPQVRRTRAQGGSAASTPSSAVSRSSVERSGASTSHKKRRLNGHAADETLQPDSNMIKTTSSDAYFIAQARTKTKSSTGSALISSQVGPVDTAALRRVTSTTTPAHGGPYSSAALHESTLLQARPRFAGWAAALGTGHSLIFHGAGSKDHILLAFVREKASAGLGGAAVIKGNGADLRLEHILSAVERAGEYQSDTAAADLNAELANAGSRVEARAMRIAKFLSGPTKSRVPAVFLLIHSMDAPIFLTPTAAAVIEILASAPRLYLMGSVSHMNSSMFVGGAVDDLPGPPASWLWYELHTFIPRVNDILLTRPGAKIAGLPSVLDPSGGSTKSGRANLAGDAKTVDNLGPTASLVTAASVLKAVSANHRTFLCLLVREQLELERAASTDSPPVSVSSDRALELARGQILGASAATLRSLLVEFITHDVIVRIASAEGLDEGSLRVHMKVEDMEELLKEYEKV